MAIPLTLSQVLSSQTPVQNWLSSQSQSQSHIATDGQSVSQSSLGVEPHLGLMTRYLLLFDSYGLVFVGRPPWRKDGSVFCICCWPIPAQCFSGPSPLGLATIFYYLRFETSLFVVSHDSQGHGGGIRPRLHTRMSKVKPCPLLITSRHEPQRKQLFYCCVWIRCSGNVFKRPWYIRPSRCRCIATAVHAGVCLSVL
jgi:hypothetical protein